MIAHDAAGNANTASTSTDNTVTYDIVAPTVTIKQATAQPDPTCVKPINFTVIFSKVVKDFTSADVTITGTAAGTKTKTVTGSGTTYNVAVTGMNTSGTVIATIAAGVAHDAADNASKASTSTDNTVTYDIVAPTVIIKQATAQPDPTCVKPINFTVTFSEVVKDLTSADVTIAGTAGGTKTKTVTGSGTTYNVAVTGMTTSGTVIGTVAAGMAHDAAGNASKASTSTDNTVSFIAAPTITSFTPAFGSAGTTVTITGANFMKATAVKFNGVAAKSFTLVSGTSIKAVAPNTSTGKITVTTPGGTATSVASFTVIPLPKTEIAYYNFLQGSWTSEDGSSSWHLPKNFSISGWQFTSSWLTAPYGIIDDLSGICFTDNLENLITTWNITIENYDTITVAPGWNDQGDISGVASRGRWMKQTHAQHGVFHARNRSLLSLFCLITYFASPPIT